MYVRYNSCNISLPTSAKQKREITKFFILLEREPRRLIVFFLFLLFDPIPDSFSW